MKPIINPFNEIAYEFKTPEGLKVILVHKKGFKRSVAAYGTPFGALNLLQKSNGESYEHKKGLAHFLEHKLFEDEDGDILSQFAAMGASANAFTSFEQTIYYFSTNLDIKEPLELLMKFVNRLNISEESVEKEKGIIVEELKMYENNPDSNLLYKTYENTYQNYPLRYDIGGTEESVNATTLEDLETAYRLNYQSSRMCLVVVSGQNPEEVKEIISSVTLPKNRVSVEDVFEEEPLEVTQTRYEYEFPVLIPKMSLAFKFAYDGHDIMKDTFLIRLILQLNFSEFNDDFQDWLDEDIINEYYSFHADLREGFGVIFFFNEGKQSDVFEEIITQRMSNLVVSQEDFDQLSKRYYGQTILSLSQYDRYAINLMNSYFKDTDYYSYLETIRELKYEEVQQMLLKLKNFNKSFTKMNSKIK